MKFIKKTIFTGFAPNLMKDDLALSLKYLFLPWKWSLWKVGKGGAQVVEWLQKYFGVKYALTLDSGRSGILLALKAMGVGLGDEVILQAYTCMVVVNAIKNTGATPIYADIDDSFNLDISDLEKKISPQTRVIIVQHTFGAPARIDEIMDIAKSRGVKVLEDCAHSLGAEYLGKKLGTFADAAIFSFGSDKVVSCVRGGAIITNNEIYFERLKNYYARLPSLPSIKILQNLLSYIIFFKGKLLYSYFIGKFIFYGAKKLHLIPKIVSDEEKWGKQSIYYPAKLPNGLAYLALNQLNKLSSLNFHRRKIAELYNQKIINPKFIKPKMAEGGIFLRYTMLCDTPDVLRIMAKKAKIILGDWYNSPIAPADIYFGATDYNIGSCPVAENMAAKSVNLPTDINVSGQDAKRIINLINEY